MSSTLPAGPKQTERAHRAIARAARDRRARVGAGAAAAAGAVAVAARAIARSRGADGATRAYRLRAVRPPAKEAVRVAYGRIDDAIEQLRDHDLEPASAVHEARKDMKKLRSLLRLGRPALGSELYRRENQRFRDLGRALSETRDAEVKLQTLAALRGRGLAADGLDSYAQALAGERADAEASEERLRQAIGELESARECVKEWQLTGWTPTGKGLRREYRRGRKALAAVRAEPSDAAVHEWRKRSKDLWYHLRLLGDARPEVLAPAADQAHELSDLLGDHHDLAVLAEDVKARRNALSSETRLAALAAIRERQRELLAEALPLGERLYAEKPKEFTRRLGAYWSASAG
jgi:CHAD domain-containing protein